MRTPKLSALDQFKLSIAFMSDIDVQNVIDCCRTVLYSRKKQPKRVKKEKLAPVATQAS